MKKGRSIKALALAAMVAALYIAATGLFAPISFGGIQVRVSEALCALALFSLLDGAGADGGLFVEQPVLEPVWDPLISPLVRWQRF